MPPVISAAAGFTSPGRRNENEDAYAIVSLAEGAWAGSVADGMGGYSHGSAASQAAVAAFNRTLSSGGRANREALEEAFAAAVDAVADTMRELESENSGTTLVGAIVDRDGAGWVAHAGDSAAVLVTREGIRRLTVDHSFVAEEIRLGRLTESDSYSHPLRNAVTRALDSTPVTPDWNEVAADQPAVLILATDGVLKFVGDDDIARITQTAASADDAVRRIVLEAIRNGGDDNATAVALPIRGWEWTKLQRRLRAIVALILAALIVAAAMFVVYRAKAQTVTSVTSSNVTVDAGERQGVRSEMTGRFCKSQKIAGKSIDVCPATFRIVSVSKNSSVATVTRGVASQVTAGFRAVFDQKLVREPQKTKPRSREAAPAPAAREVDPVAMLAAAELSYDRGDGDAALDAFRRLLKNTPSDEYLARRAADAAQHVAPPKPSREIAPTSEELALAREITDAANAGRPGVEKTVAAKLLALNAENAAALYVRARSRAMTWNRARATTHPWQRAAAWQEHLESFATDTTAERELERHVAKTAENFATLADRHCSDVAVAVNQVPIEVRQANWFRAAVSAAAAAWSCPFAGLPQNPVSPELTLVVLTVRHQRPLPGVAVAINAAGKSSAASHSLAAKGAKCSPATPCELSFAVAAGEEYQLAMSGTSFRQRAQPVTIVALSSPAAYCVTQKLTRISVGPCAAE